MISIWAVVGCRNTEERTRRRACADFAPPLGFWSCPAQMSERNDGQVPGSFGKIKILKGFSYLELGKLLGRFVQVAVSNVEQLEVLLSKGQNQRLSRSNLIQVTRAGDGLLDNVAIVLVTLQVVHEDVGAVTQADDS